MTDDLIQAPETVPGPETAPDPQPQPDPEPTPQPGYRYRVLDEETELPRNAVDEISRATGYAPEDVPRYLGMGRKRDLHPEPRQSSREAQALAAQVERLERQIDQINRFREESQGFDPSQLDPAVRPIYDRMERFERNVGTFLSGIEEDRKAKRAEEQQTVELEEQFESISEWAESQSLPTFTPKQFFREMDRSGLANSRLSSEQLSETIYQRLLNRKLLSERGNGNGHGKPTPNLPQAPSSPQRPQMRTSVRAPAVPSAPQSPRDDTQPVPGETTEQKLARLERAIGNRSFADLLPRES